MGKTVLISMLIMSMLLNVAVGFFDPLKTVANQAQKGVQDIAKQAFGRKTMEKNGEEQLQVPADWHQGQNNAGKVNEAKFFFNPLDPIANIKQGTNAGNIPRKTMEEDDHDCDHDRESENNAERNDNGNGDSDDDTNDASDANDPSDGDEGQDITETIANAGRKVINQLSN